MYWPLLLFITKFKSHFVCSYFQIYFFNKCYLALSWPTFRHSWGNSLTDPMSVTAFVQVRPEGHHKPRSKVGSLSLTEHLVGFELGGLVILIATS